VYMLEGLVVCDCGAPMRIRSAYTTRRRWHRPAAYQCAAKCGAKHVHTSVADDAAWSAICARLEDPTIVADLAAMDAAQAGDASTWEADAASARARLERLTSVETTVMARFRRGLISEAALDTELVAIRRERSQANEQVKSATRARGQASSAQARLQAASLAIGDLRAALAAADPEERRAIVMTVVDPGGVQVVGAEIRVDLWIARGVTARGSTGSASALAVVAHYSDDHESRLKVRVVARLAA
jgi:hypothetical protein